MPIAKAPPRRGDLVGRPRFPGCDGLAYDKQQHPDPVDGRWLGEQVHRGQVTASPLRLTIDA